MQIIVKTVLIEQKKGGKNTYEMAEVIYTFKGETRTKKVVSFAAPEVFKVIKDAQPGNVLDITMEKNEKTGYMDWIGAQLVTEEVASAPDSKSPSKTVPATRSTYETPEERAKKQVYIIKQSSLGSAVDTLGSGADPDDVIALADRYVDWVMSSDEDDLFQADNDLD